MLASQLMFLKIFNLHLTNEPNAQSSMVLFFAWTNDYSLISLIFLPCFTFSLRTFAYMNKVRKSQMYSNKFFILSMIRIKRIAEIIFEQLQRNYSSPVLYTTYYTLLYISIKLILICNKFIYANKCVLSRTQN